MRTNTPGQRNGEVKYSINGKLVGDFPDLNMRSINTLKIDKAGIGLHAGHSKRVNKKWYDNVVIAKQYIGPMARASSIRSSTPLNDPLRQLCKVSRIFPLWEWYKQVTAY